MILFYMCIGLYIFQGYIEWSVASSALGYFSSSSWSSQRLSSMKVAVCSGLCFYCIDALQRDVQQAEDRHMASNKNRDQKKSTPRMSYTLQTLQSVTVIVCTNSLVNFAMQVVSPVSSGAGASRTAAGVASSLATVAAGLIVAKTAMQVVDAHTTRPANHLNGRGG